MNGLDGTQITVLNTGITGWVYVRTRTTLALQPPTHRCVTVAYIGIR